MNLLQLLHEAVKANPDKICLQAKQDGRYHGMTYQQFWDSILSFAEGLKRLGVKQGDRVAIMAENCPEWAMSDYAILLLGAVVVPIYPTVPSSQACFMLKNAGVTWAIVGSGPNYETIMAGQPAFLHGVILIKDEAASGSVPVYPLSEVMEYGTLTQLEPDTIASFERIRENALATIVHTSGTSGQPKGVMLSHGNIVANVRSCLSVAPVIKEDTCLSYLPLSHIFERTVGQYATLSSGGTIAYAESIETIRENLLEVRPTILITVPRLLEKVYAGVQQKLDRAPKGVKNLLSADLKAPLHNRRNASKWLADMIVYRKLRKGLGGRLRMVVSGGAGLSKEIAEFYMRAGILVCEGYGMTETAPVICVNPPNAPVAGTVGRPIPGVNVRIAEDGELLVRGPNVMLGYYMADEETMKAFTEDGWLKTGDIAEFDGDYIRIVDRKKNILVLATGKNVAPWPIENAISLSPYIADTVLIGDGKKYVTCLIVPDKTALAEQYPELKGYAEDDETWITHPAVTAQMKHDIVKATDGFADFERPKRARLLPKTFSLESGELTPTLKVKTSLIVRQYQKEIDEMYSGKQVLILFDTLQEVAAGIEPPQVEGESAMRKHRHGAEARTLRSSRRLWIWCLPIIILLLLAAAFLHIRIPKAYNLLGIITHIAATNNDINHQNQNIVDHMAKVSDLSSMTPRIAASLGQLNNGLMNQNRKLSTLSNLSQQEVELSVQFRKVATDLSQDLGGISTSSNAQSRTVSRMSHLAAQMDATVHKLTATNQRAAQKLNTARSDTEQVANEVP